MAYDYSKKTDKQLRDMMAANSQDWHTAGSQAEKDALHQQNQAIQKILDSRTGGSSSFDSSSGTWSSTAGSGGSRSKPKSSSSGSQSSGSGPSSGGSGTPEWMKSLAGGNNPWATGLDDQGDIDYSVALQRAIASGADYDTVARLLQGRIDKLAASPSLYAQYNNDGINDMALQYLLNLQGQQQAAAPSYTGQYDGQWDEVNDRLQDMSYEDWTRSKAYKDLAARYGQLAGRGMDDVLGRLAAQTGGLASSYAVTAAQQQYNETMSRLEEVARQMYDADRGDLMENLGVLQALDQRDYNRYLGQLGQYNTDRSFQYQAGRDLLNDQRYDREYADQREDLAWERQEEQDRGRAALLAAAGDFSGYASLWGLTPEQTRTLVDHYAREKQLSEEAAARELADWHAQYGDFSRLQGLGVNVDLAAVKGSSGKGSTDKSDPGKPVLTKTQVDQDVEAGKDYPNLRIAYEYYYGQPYPGAVDEAEKGDGEGYDGYPDLLAKISAIEDQAMGQKAKVKQIINLIEAAYADGNGTISPDQAEKLLAQYGVSGSN